MFDKIRAIDWQSMNAARLPDWIMGLTSTDQDIATRSALRLEEYLCHYVEWPGAYEPLLSTDAPVLATPFLIALLNHPQTNKTSLLFILEILSRYHGVKELKAPYSIRASQIYQILLSHFDLYLPFLDSENSQERVHVMDFMGHFGEKSPFVIEELLRRIENNREPDELGKLVATEVIFRGMQKSETLAAQILSRFIQIMRRWVSASNEAMPIRIQGAEYLHRLLGDQVDPAIGDVIMTALTLPNRAEFHQEIHDYTTTLLEVGGNHALDILLRMLAIQTDLYEVFHTVSTLLALAFYDRRINWVYLSNNTDPKGRNIVKVYTLSTIPLNDQQKSILKHILNKQQIWEAETNLFELFSLPDSIGSLERLLAET